MKSKSAIGLMMTLVMLCTGCNTVVQPDSKVSSEPNSIVKPNSELPTQELPESTSESTVNQSVEVVYNEDEFLTWMPNTPEKEENDVCSALRRIHQVRYGAAGASLDMAGAAASMIKELTESPVLEKELDSYLQQLTPLQRDYFSFQWQSVYDTAVRMIQSPENYQPLLEDAGREDVELAAGDANRLEDINRLVRTKLDAYGVCDSWKNYPELEPFCLHEET